jgi:hypothetical protein
VQGALWHAHVNGDAEIGYWGESPLFEGVRGTGHSSQHAAITAFNPNAPNADAGGRGNEAIHADANSDTTACVAAHNHGKGPALYGSSTTAAVFQGDVSILKFDPKEPPVPTAGRTW